MLVLDKIFTICSTAFVHTRCCSQQYIKVPRRGFKKYQVIKSKSQISRTSDIIFLYSTRSFSLSKCDAYITHNATHTLTIQSEIHTLNVSFSC